MAKKKLASDDTQTGQFGRASRQKKNSAEVVKSSDKKYEKRQL